MAVLKTLDLANAHYLNAFFPDIVLVRRFCLFFFVNVSMMNSRFRKHCSELRVTVHLLLECARCLSAKSDSRKKNSPLVL